MKQEKIDKAIWECYRRLYKNSSPSADFDTLYENADIDETGIHMIPYESHEIDQAQEIQIIEDIMKEYKIPKYLQDSFRTTIVLGCSPRIKK